MSGFHTATICGRCDPPVVAISTGGGSRCPGCGQVDEHEEVWPWSDEFSDGALARRVLRDMAVRSDGDARLLTSLAQRLLDRVGTSAALEARVAKLEEEAPALDEELSELQDLADLVSDADIAALPPELQKVRERWYAEAFHHSQCQDEERLLQRQAEDRRNRRPGQRSPVVYVDLLADGSTVVQESAPSTAACPHCVAGEPSIWDDVLFHYAHPGGEKLKLCHSPWRARCLRCSADVANLDLFCAEHLLERQLPAGESP